MAGKKKTVKAQLIDLQDRDVITTQEFSVAELEAILTLAFEMKKNRYCERHAKLMLRQTFTMLFYNPSLRTRQSFEAAATELGGHAQFLEPKAMRLKSVSGNKDTAGESIHDAAKVIARYSTGMGIRILENSVDKYGDGNWVLREYAKFADIPVLNMADDIYHPCQGLADNMGMRLNVAKGETTRGKTLLQTWASGKLARSYCSVHESLLINSRLGMNVRLAFPKGYELPDTRVLDTVKENCKRAGTKFEIVNDPVAGYTGADYVYSRNWFGPDFYQIGKDAEIARASDPKYKDWICDERKMKIAGFNAKFIHPMPVDEEHEVTPEVNRGPRSIIMDIAECRLHVQKALMAMTIGGVKMQGGKIIWPKK